MIPLSGGFPNPQMFPFKQLTLEVTGGDPIVLEGKGLQVNHVFFSPQPNFSQAALQYLPTPGHPKLLQQLRQLQQEAHSPHKVIRDITGMAKTLLAPCPGGVVEHRHGGHLWKSRRSLQSL